MGVILKGFGLLFGATVVAIAVTAKPPEAAKPAPVVAAAAPAKQWPTAASLAVPDRRRDKAATVSACEALVRSKVRHTSTFTGLSGVEFHTGMDGTASASGDFSAKNSYGLELVHRAFCKVDTAGRVTVAIAER